MNAANQIMRQRAHQYRRLGIPVFPLCSRSKRPLGPWHEFTRRLPTEQEIDSWFASARNTEPNIGGVMGHVSGFVAIDADSHTAAERLKRLLPPTSMVTITPRGAHFLFRLRSQQTVPSRVHAMVLSVLADVRSDGTYVCLADSVHPCGIRYEQLGTWNPTHAPFFDDSWLDDPPTDNLESPLRRRDKIRSVPSYLARVESIQGRHGSAGLVRACAICRDAGLSEAEAMVELLRWNQSPVVVPAWSNEELVRAVTRVYSKQT
jgi:hypothetical protein